MQRNVYVDINQITLWIQTFGFRFDLINVFL